MKRPDMRSLTGRISQAPTELLHEEVLAPQFDYDVNHLLPFYLHMEKVLLLEYARLGVLSADDTRAVALALHKVSAASLTADPQSNLSDLSFAIEVAVGRRLPAPVPSWRVDRSRNDFQACGQLQLGRAQTIRTAEELLACAAAVHELAVLHAYDPMPGYTHLQPAQVITPAFFLSAVCEHMLHFAERLLVCYDGWDAAPLGAGAMAGQQLPWDRDRLAELLGFAKPAPHALTAVASRGWLLELAAECATFGIGMSRFVTDLMTWAGGQHSFVSLPDEMAAISSAMPQKKNYPILERLRGKSSHALSWYVDTAATQRATPFSNSVEVSKESGTQMVQQLSVLRSMLRLAAAVFGHLSFDTERLREACEEDHLGAFALANELTLADGIPWREAQVITGAYVLAAQRNARPATRPDPELLLRIAAAHGHEAGHSAAALEGLLRPEAELERKATAGSTAPHATMALLQRQKKRIGVLTADWNGRREVPEAAARRVDQLLGLGAP